MLKTEGGEVASNISTQTLDDLPILNMFGAAAGIGSANALGNIRNPLSSVQLLPERAHHHGHHPARERNAVQFAVHQH